MLMIYARELSVRAIRYACVTCVCVHMCVCARGFLALFRFLCPHPPAHAFNAACFSVNQPRNIVFDFYVLHCFALNAMHRREWLSLLQLALNITRKQKVQVHAQTCRYQVRVFSEFQYKDTHLT